jgi:hypothetical protein
MEHARELDAALAVAAEAFAGLLAVQLDFESRQPGRIPGFQSLIVSDGVKAVVANLRSRLRPDEYLKVPTMTEIVTNEVNAAMIFAKGEEDENGDSSTNSN